MSWCFVTAAPPKLLVSMSVSLCAHVHTKLDVPGIIRLQFGCALCRRRGSSLLLRLAVQLVVIALSLASWCEYRLLNWQRYHKLAMCVRCVVLPAAVLQKGPFSQHAWLLTVQSVAALYSTPWKMGISARCLEYD